MKKHLIAATIPQIEEMLKLVESDIEQTEYYYTEDNEPKVSTHLTSQKDLHAHLTKTLNILKPLPLRIGSIFSAKGFKGMIEVLGIDGNKVSVSMDMDSNGGSGDKSILNFQIWGLKDINKGFETGEYFKYKYPFTLD